ncbi:23946_t:CDS:1, partial [Dentiscutata erythropus]
VFHVLNRLIVENSDKGSISDSESFPTIYSYPFERTSSLPDELLD